MICNLCGQDSWIPDGVSKKSGKPYKAFCSNKSCVGNNLTKENGVTKEVVQSQLPSKVPPANGDLRERTMVMSYAKDVVCKRIETGVNEPGDAAVQIIVIYRQLMSELTNPLR